MNLGAIRALKQYTIQTNLAELPLEIFSLKVFKNSTDLFYRSEFYSLEASEKVQKA